MRAWVGYALEAKAGGNARDEADVGTDTSHERGASNGADARRRRSHPSGWDETRVGAVNGGRGSAPQYGELSVPRIGRRQVPDAVKVACPVLKRRRGE